VDITPLEEFREACLSAWIGYDSRRVDFRSGRHSHNSSDATAGTAVPPEPHLGASWVYMTHGPGSAPRLLSRGRKEGPLNLHS
jgi:hypothetical protein